MIKESMVIKVRVMLLIITAIALISAVSAYEQTTISFIENHTINDFTDNQTIIYEIPSYTETIQLTGDQTLAGTVIIPAHNITLTYPPVQVVNNSLGHDLDMQIMIVIAFIAFPACYRHVIQSCIMWRGLVVPSLFRCPVFRIWY